MFAGKRRGGSGGDSISKIDGHAVSRDLDFLLQLKILYHLEGRHWTATRILADGWNVDELT